MKLEIARGLFFVGALSVVSLCAMAWSEPVAKVVSRSATGHFCPVPRVPVLGVVRPDGDLLLFIYSMSQGLVGRG